jgi:putative addiction module component (TIGR02574 family)
MSIPDDLLERVMALPEGDRLKLVRRILADPGPREPGQEEAWAAEIEGRLRAIDDSRMPVSPLEEVRARLQPAAPQQAP